jgi:hypothetical protein
MEEYAYQAQEMSSAKMALVGSSRRPTLLENLGQRKAALEAELDKVNGAIASLQAAPEATALLESLRKVSGLL